MTSLFELTSSYIDKNTGHSGKEPLGVFSTRKDSENALRNDIKKRLKDIADQTIQDGDILDDWESFSTKILAIYEECFERLNQVASGYDLYELILDTDSGWDDCIAVTKYDIISKSSEWYDLNLPQNKCRKLPRINYVLETGDFVKFTDNDDREFTGIVFMLPNPSESIQRKLDLSYQKACKKDEFQDLYWILAAQNQDDHMGLYFVEENLLQPTRNIHEFTMHRLRRSLQFESANHRTYFLEDTTLNVNKMFLNSIKEPHILVANNYFDYGFDAIIGIENQTVLSGKPDTMLNLDYALQFVSDNRMGLLDEFETMRSS